MSRQLTGTLRAPDGTPLPNETLIIVADRNEEASNVVRSSFYAFNTTGLGAYNFTLLNGFYRVMRQINGSQLYVGNILVEDGSATTLTDLLALNETPAYPGALALAAQLSQAQQAAADAAAALAAATVLFSGAPPVIVTHPQSVDVSEGASILLSSSAFNYITVQWYRNGVAIAGATNTTYAFTAAPIHDGDIVFARFSNSAGSVDSLHAAIEIDQLPVIDNQNVDAIVGIGVFIVLGPPNDGDGDPITYNVTPPGNYVQNNNTIVYTAPAPGQVQLLVEADDGINQVQATIDIDAQASDGFATQINFNNLVVQ